MPRHGGRRVVKTDDDEIEMINSMSEEALKEHVQMMIQRESIGNAYADEIKYGEKSSAHRPTSTLHILPACERKGTKEAEIASQHEPKLTGWKTFHTTVPASDIPTDDAVRNMHGHRALVRQELREAAVNLGLESVQELTLNDTYGNQGGRQYCKKGAPASLKSSFARSHPYSVKPPASKPLASTKATSKSKRGKAEQSRPWPPAALVGTSALASKTNMKSNVSPAKVITQRLTGMPPAPDLPTAQPTPAKARPTATGEGASFMLSDPSDFLSKMKEFLPNSPNLNEQSTPQEAAPTLMNGQNAPTPPVTEAAQAIAASNLNDPAILRIPVTEFSFPATAALGAGEISTHTDGKPSPATLSGFSSFTNTTEQAAVPDESHTDDLIGLGIANIDMPDAAVIDGPDVSSSAPTQSLNLSPSGSLIDSPIMDNVNVQVLKAEPGSILDIAGRKYIALDDLLKLRDAIENKINAAMAGKASPATPSAATLDPSATRTTQLALVSSSASSSTATTAVPSRPTNPFNTREPLANNDANIPSTAPAFAGVNKNVATAEPIKVSSNTRAEPFSSNTTIESKWADKPASQPASSIVNTSNNVVEPNLGSDPLKRLARPTPFASNNTIGAKWAAEPPPAPAPWPAPRLNLRPRSPIIGDRKVIGATFPKIDYPAPRRPPQVPEKTKIELKHHAPGPGFHLLLKDLKITDEKA